MLRYTLHVHVLSSFLYGTRFDFQGPRHENSHILFKTALHPPYHEPTESSPHPISALKTNFDIITLFIPKESKWTFLFRHSHQVIVCIVTYTVRATCPA